MELKHSNQVTNNCFEEACEAIDADLKRGEEIAAEFNSYINDTPEEIKRLSVVSLLVLGDDEVVNKQLTESIASFLGQDIQAAINKRGNMWHAIIDTTLEMNNNSQRIIVDVHSAADLDDCLCFEPIINDDNSIGFKRRIIVLVALNLNQPSSSINGLEEWFDTLNKLTSEKTNSSYETIVVGCNSDSFEDILYEENPKYDIDSNFLLDYSLIHLRKLCLKNNSNLVFIDNENNIKNTFSGTKFICSRIVRRKYEKSELEAVLFDESVKNFCIPYGTDSQERIEQFISINYSENDKEHKKYAIPEGLSFTSELTEVLDVKESDLGWKGIKNQEEDLEFPDVTKFLEKIYEIQKSNDRLQRMAKAPDFRFVDKENLPDESNVTY